MDTIRVDICDRPLRIGWAINSRDIEAFRRAIRLSYALWGGRFNPILIADNDKETKKLVDLFRVDLILPLSDTEPAKTLPETFPYLINPTFHSELFAGGPKERKRAQILDVHNALVHLIDRPPEAVISARLSDSEHPLPFAVWERGVRLVTWEPHDPLADLFLIQYGSYPSEEEAGLDYRALLKRASDALELSNTSMSSRRDHTATCLSHSCRCATDSRMAFSHAGMISAYRARWFVDQNHQLVGDGLL